jgi:hypothetical protein
MTSQKIFQKLRNSEDLYRSWNHMKRKSDQFKSSDLQGYWNLQHSGTIPYYTNPSMRTFRNLRRFSTSSADRSNDVNFCRLNSGTIFDNLFVPKSLWKKNCSYSWCRKEVYFGSECISKNCRRASRQHNNFPYNF